MARNRRKDIDERKEEILSLYSNKSKGIMEIAKLMNCDFCVIKRILQENNIKIRPQKYYMKGRIPPNKLNLNEKKIIDMYLNQNIPGTKIAKQFNCDNSVIYDILNKNNVKIKGNSHFLKGKISSIKNKTFEEIYGKERANKLKEKASEATKKVMKNPNHRKMLSEIRIKGIEEGRIKIPKGEKHHLFNKTYEEIYGSEKAEEKRKKASATHQGISLEEWEGYTGIRKYGKSFSNKFKRTIRKRDNYECLKCGLHQEKSSYVLDVHHINYDKLISIPQNCCTLCHKCNSEVNKNRLHWTKFFQSLLSERYGYQYSENKEIILNLNNQLN